MSVSRLKKLGFDTGGYSYALLHTAMHGVLMGILYLIVQPDLSIDLYKIGLIIFGTILIDLDHVPLWLEKGLKGYLELRSVEEFGKPRRYFAHNFFVIIASLGGSLFMLLSDFFPLGLISAAIAVHLLWDLLEDLIVFDMGYGHWI